MHILQHLTICGLLVAAYTAEDLLAHADDPLEDAPSTSNFFSVFGFKSSTATTMASPTTSLFDGSSTTPHFDESTIGFVDELFTVATEATVSTTATAAASTQTLPGETSTIATTTTAAAAAEAAASTTPTAAGEPTTSGSTEESTPSPIGSQIPVAYRTDATTMKCSKHLIGHHVEDGQNASPLTSSGCCQHQNQNLDRASRLLQLLFTFAFFWVFY